MESRKRALESLSSALERSTQCSGKLVFTNATARAALMAYDSSLLKPSPDLTPLFLSEKRHTQLTERGLGYLIKKYADRAHVSDVSPHDLRHRFGYRMAQAVPLHRLAQLMGHDSLDTTLIYVQGTKEDLQQAVETIAWT